MEEGIPKEFNLIYYHKETGKRYFVKRIIKDHYLIMDPETGVKIGLSISALKRAFVADKENEKRKRKVTLEFTKVADTNN